MMAFAGKTVLVIGGSAGIGRACVDQLAEQGALVIGTTRDPDKAFELSSRYQKSQPNVMFDVLDLGDELGIERFFKELRANHPALDGAVNNAGLTQDAFHFADTPKEVINDLLAVNVKGTFLAMQEEIRWMRESGAGSIVNIASIAGLRGVKNLAMYTLSKHAVVGMTKVAAQDVATDGIRVNATCPGTTRTEMMERQMLTRPGGEEATRASIPMDRISSSGEQANAILWLLSDEASYITGEMLTVDGGRTID